MLEKRRESLKDRLLRKILSEDCCPSWLVLGLLTFEFLYIAAVINPNLPSNLLGNFYGIPTFSIPILASLGCLFLQLAFQVSLFRIIYLIILT